ncbi:MAG: nucleoside deaminase [Erysipelotrichaceae bacterium]
MKRIIVLCLCLLIFGGCKSSSVKIPEKAYNAENEYMNMAIDEARQGIYNHHGGPFGSVIVKDGKVIGQGHNMVLINNDSTAHGEISAIRDAEKNLGTYDLSGSALYTTGEPCPMCLAAAMWANIDVIYYGCTIEDNEIIGFRDAKFDEMFGGREAFRDYLIEMDRQACLELFEEYSSLEHVIY